MAQRHRENKSAARRSIGNLFVATVAFLSVLQVAIAAALPAVHDSGVGHVKETLSTSSRQVALQLPQVAVVEHTREWMAEDQDRKGVKKKRSKSKVKIKSCIINIKINI